MKINSLIIFLLICTLISAPLCSADVGDVILAPAKVVDYLLWVPAIVLVLSVGVPMYYMMKLDESLQKKEIKNVS